MNISIFLELRKCDVSMYISRSYDFNEFYSLDNITHIYGRYNVNFKVYTLVKKDVHILVASRDLETDSAFEISKFCYERIDNRDYKANNYF